MRMGKVVVSDVGFVMGAEMAGIFIRRGYGDYFQKRGVQIGKV